MVRQTGCFTARSDCKIKGVLAACKRVLGDEVDTAASGSVFSVAKQIHMKKQFYYSGQSV